MEYNRESVLAAQVANSVREQGEVNPGSNDEQVSHYCKWCKFLLRMSRDKAAKEVTGHFETLQ